MTPHKPGAPIEPPASRPGRLESWRGFAQRHPYDYNAAAKRRWLFIVAAGVLSALHALVTMVAGFGHGGSQLLVVVLYLALVAIVAGFPVQIPRTKYSICVANVFVFALLALQGPELAVLAAAIEGGVGACRASKRWSSRLSTPSAEQLKLLLEQLGAYAYQVGAEQLAQAQALLVRQVLRSLQQAPALFLEPPRLTRVYE